MEETAGRRLRDGGRRSIPLLLKPGALPLLGRCRVATSGRRGRIASALQTFYNCVAEDLDGSGIVLNLQIAADEISGTAVCANLNRRPVIVELEIASDCGSTDLIVIAARRNVLNLEIAVNGCARANAERPAASNLHVSANGGVLEN